MKYREGNKHKLKHMPKKKLRKEVSLVQFITCASDVLQRALCLLNPIVHQVLSSKEIATLKFQ